MSAIITSHYTIHDKDGRVVGDKLKQQLDSVGRLTAENDRLREALRPLESAARRRAADLDAEPGNQIAVTCWLSLADAAHAALEQQT